MSLIGDWPLLRQLIRRDPTALGETAWSLATRADTRALIGSPAPHACVLTGLGCSTVALLLRHLSPAVHQ